MEKQAFPSPGSLALAFLNLGRGGLENALIVVDRHLPKMHQLLLDLRGGAGAQQMGR